MTVIERALALQSVSVFAGLRTQELLAIGRIAEHRDFAPGALVCSAESVSKGLIITIRGELLESGMIPVPSVIGIASLIRDSEMGADITAGEKGAECLLIGKGHFFTIIHQCPEIVRDLLKQRAPRLSEREHSGVSEPLEDSLFI